MADDKSFSLLRKHTKEGTTNPYVLKVALCIFRDLIYGWLIFARCSILHNLESSPYSPSCELCLDDTQHAILSQRSQLKYMRTHAILAVWTSSRFLGCWMHSLLRTRSILDKTQRNHSQSTKSGCGDRVWCFKEQGHDEWEPVSRLSVESTPWMVSEVRKPLP